MLGSYLHPETQEEILISADSRGYHWINAAAEERLTFDLNVEDFKLTPAEGSGHDIEITFEMEDDLVKAAIREGVTYERLIGVMETKVREEGVHLTLPEVERKAGGNIHAFICNVEDGEDWRDFSVLAAIATNSHLNSGIPAVIVDDTSPADDDAIQNLLDRLQPNQVTIFRSEDEKLQGQIKGSESASVNERTCNSLKEMNDFIATTWTGEIKQAVLVSTADYGNALLATSLACLLEAPLFVAESVEEMLDVTDFGQFSLLPLLAVGDEADFSTFKKAVKAMTGDDAELVSIPNCQAALSYLKEQGIAVNYLALTNPLDRKSKVKLSLTAPIYACAHGGLVVPLQDVELEKAKSLDAAPLTKVKEQLGEVYKVLGQPRFLNLVGTTESVPACKTTEDVNNCKDYAVTDYQYATAKFNLEDVHEIAVGRCYTDSSTAGFLLATRSVNYPVLRAAGDWKDKIVDAGLWGFPELRKIFMKANFSLAELQKDEMKPLHKVDFENNPIEATAVLHKDHSGWSGLGQCMGRHSNVMFAPCVMISLGCHAAGIDEGIPSCASRVMARGGICFTGAARCPTAIATLWSVAFFNELLDGHGKSLGEANLMAHNKFMAHRHVSLAKYTLVNRFTLGDPALRPYPQCQPEASQMAKHSFEGSSMTITGPSDWSMVEVHPDQLKADHRRSFCLKVGCKESKER